MPEAAWSGAAIAGRDDTVTVEGNHRLPAESVDRSQPADSSEQSVRPGEGTAGHHDLVVDGRTNPGASWHHPGPKDAATEITGHIGFWRCVAVEP